MTDPGWYNDERDPSRARWHDGTGWTEHTMDKAAWTGPGSPPPPASRPAAPAGPALGRPAGAPAPARPPGPPAGPSGGAGTSPEGERPWIEAPPRPSRPRRTSQWERPSGHLLGAIGALIAIAVCLLALQRVDEDREAAAIAATTTTTLPSTSDEWTTVDGHTYRVTVTPSSNASDEASTNGCIAAPGAGTTNLGFTVRLENLSPEAAPLPQVAFGVNVNAGGALDPGITTLDTASTKVELGPVKAGSSCSLARSIAPATGDPIPSGGSVDFTGVVGGIPAPVPNELSLIVRFFPADAAQVARGTGFTKKDLVVPFPDVVAKDS